MRSVCAVLLAAAVIAAAFAAPATAAGGFTKADRQRMAKVLAAGGKADLSAAYLSAAGLKALGESVPSDVCAYAAKFDANDLESIFEATRLKDAGCSGSQAAGKATVEAVLKSETRDAWKLAQAVLSADVVGAALNKDDVVKKFTAILAADYTVRGAGLMLTAVSKMGLPADKLTAFVDVVEDLVGQAEVTGDMLAFDGGLIATAAVIRGIYDISAAANKEPKISDTQVQQVVNYALAAKQAPDVKRAACVANILSVFAKNKFDKPVVISAPANLAMSTATATVKVDVSDTLGNAVSAVKASIKDVRNAKLKSVSSNTPLSQLDGTTYSGNLASAKLERGLYTVTVAVEGSGIIAPASATIKAVVAGEAEIVDTAFTVNSGDHVVKTINAKFPKASSEAVSIDESQSLRAKFAVKAKGGSAIKVHQAFLRFTNVASKAEVHFVVPYSAGSYALSLSFSENAESFGANSGKYKLALIVGDVTVSPSIEWELGTVGIEFHKSVETGEVESLYAPKAELKHTFRVPEARPPSIVSLVFAAATAAPVLILLALWIPIGANISGFPFSQPMALVFHGTLGAILVLYALYWLRLNIFDVLTYLTPLLVLLTFSGRATLLTLAKNRAKADKSD